MYKHRVGIRGLLHLLRRGHLKQLTWHEYWFVKERVLGEWSQARGRGSGSVYSPSVWKIRSLTEALQPHSSPWPLPWVLGVTHMEGLSAQLGTGASEQQPQGSEIQCWVGGGCLLRRVRMRMLILRCIRFAKFENLQHKICRSCVVLGGGTYVIAKRSLCFTCWKNCWCLADIILDFYACKKAWRGHELRNGREWVYFC